MTLTWNQFRELIQMIDGRSRGSPRLVLGLPTRTVNGVIMPNEELKNDSVYHFPILVDNQGGAVVPLPPGTTFTATSSSASLTVGTSLDGSGNPQLDCTPMVQASPNISVTIADSAGITSKVEVFDIVADLTPSAISLDTTNVTTTAQPVPTAPGP